MLPTHIKRHVDSCHQADLSNPSTRRNVEQILIPKLIRLRRELILSRRSKRLGLDVQVQDDLMELKLAVRIARDRLAEAA